MFVNRKYLFLIFLLLVSCNNSNNNSEEDFGIFSFRHTWYRYNEAEKEEIVNVSKEELLKFKDCEIKALNGLLAKSDIKKTLDENAINKFYYLFEESYFYNIELKEEYKDSKENDGFIEFPKSVCEMDQGFEISVSNDTDSFVFNFYNGDSEDLMLYSFNLFDKESSEMRSFKMNEFDYAVFKNKELKTYILDFASSLFSFCDFPLTY